MCTHGGLTACEANTVDPETLNTNARNAFDFFKREDF
jgi:hypothetical protein